MRREGFALLFALTFPTLMAWAYFVALPGPTGPAPESSRPRPVVQGVYAAGKVLQFAFRLL